MDIKNMIIQLSRTKFFWETLNGIISSLIVYTNDMEAGYIVVFMIILNIITKKLNKYYNPFY